MNTHLTFAITRFNRRMALQEYEVIRFSEEGIYLLSGNETTRNLLWSEMVAMDFIPVPKRNVWMTALAGSMLRGQEAQFHIYLENEVIQIPLEADAEFRTADLQAAVELAKSHGISGSKK